SIQDNQLTGPIPSNFGNLSSLISVSLRNNLITGEIPRSFGNLSNLVDLNLSGNLINGAIPESFSNLKKLSFVDLGRTQLTGVLPESLSQMTNLAHLYVYSTNVSGPLPKSLAKLPKLATIGLWNNSISGSIPEEYANISTLLRLYVESNLVSGDIPLSFSNLTNLQLDVSDNCLSTPIPVELSTHKGFITIPQKVICQKFAPENPVSPTRTPEVISNVITNHSTTLQPPTESSPSIVGSTVTIVQIQSASGTVSIETPTTAPGIVNSYSNRSQVILIALSLGFGSTFLLLIVAGGVLVHKRTKAAGGALNGIKTEDAVNEDQVLELDVVAIAVSREEVVTADLSEEKAPSSLLSNEFTPVIQRDLLSKPTTQQGIELRVSHNPPSQEKLQGDLSVEELQPDIQRELYLQTVREAAPTSNINLENHLQRLYGLYTTWSHEFVMDWANVKRLDPAVVKIFREKFDIQDFRLRAKVIQAVEFLKDSARVISERPRDDDERMDNLLPEYQPNE
ncbi:hypothetical protein HDU76_005148, partial [Blyttiomyces sp. JEL0837]